MGKILSKKHLNFTNEKEKEGLKKIMRDKLDELNSKTPELVAEETTVRYKVSSEEVYKSLLSSMTKKGFNLVGRNGSEVVFKKVVNVGSLNL